MSGNKIVRVVIGSKVWEMPRKMAKATINIAKQKYEKENVKAIVGVEKDNVISLQKDVYTEAEAFEKAISDWEKGGYKCYHTK